MFFVVLVRIKRIKNYPRLLHEQDKFNLPFRIFAGYLGKIISSQHCVKRVVIQYCITRVFMCYAHVIHVLSACV